MFGYLSFAPQGERLRGGVRPETKTIGGVRFFAVSVEQSRSRMVQVRRLRRAARIMERAGVRAALFPAGFTEDGLFAKRQIRKAGAEYLRRMTAGAIARRAMAEHGLRPAECHAVLIGDHMSGELRKALMEIALHVRYTMLAAGGGGGEICSVLRREYGVSVLRDPGQEQLRRANLVLTFGSAVPCGGNGCLWLPFGEVTQAEGFCSGALQVRYGVPPEVEAALPADCDRNGLLSVLLEMGALRANELEVLEILQNA